MPARPDPAAWGVVGGFTDATGVRRRASRTTVVAVLDALGADAPAPAGRASVVLAPDQGAALERRGHLTLEDGSDLGSVRRLPPDLPMGIHRLTEDGGAERLVIVAPARCPLPERQRAGGLAVQLYAARSRGSWGIGDLADLRSLGAWAAGLGARAVLVSPLHAPVPALPQQPSPYSPSSRRFRTPLALRIEEVDGFDGADPEMRRLAGAGRRLGEGRLVDRDAVHRLKSAALDRLFERAGRDRRLDAYREEMGTSLERFAVHSALVEVHGADWRTWPEELRHPDSAAVARAARALRARVDRHAWTQWQLDRQLAAASAAIPVMHDLAIGVDPAGADAWIDQDVLAAGVRVGAPPDEFNTQGQDWGLPPFHPWRLRASGYRAFRETVRAGLRHAGALRFDHVMGLFRLWWVPPGRGAREGAYVRYPADDLLAVLALEAERAGAYVVGEDLGTVAPGTRAALARRDVLSYRLLWFEDGPPARYPRRSMAAVTTHDLPTVAGLWSGSDLAAQRRLGLEPDPAATERVLDRVRALGVEDGTPPAQVSERLHEALAAGSAALVTATLDDLALVEERPNMPGTVDAWPNWCLGLPLPIEELMDSELAQRVTAMVARRRRVTRAPSTAAPGSAGTRR